jgi:hypothetical protein
MPEEQHWLGQYMLDGQGNPVPERDLLTWARWMETGTRVLKQTDLGIWGFVSTVFLALDHNFCLGLDAKPVLWETMIFGGPYDQEQYRYSSREEALAGHEELVAKCMDARKSGKIFYWWLVVFAKRLLKFAQFIWGKLRKCKLVRITRNPK